MYIEQFSVNLETRTCDPNANRVSEVFIGSPYIQIQRLHVPSYCILGAHSFDAVLT